MASDPKGKRILAKPTDYSLRTVNTKSGPRAKIEINFTYMDEDTNKEVMARASEWLTENNMQSHKMYDRLEKIGYDKKNQGLDDFKYKKIKLVDACWIDVQINRRRGYVYRNALIVLDTEEKDDEEFVDDDITNLFDKYADQHTQEGKPKTPDEEQGNW